MKNYLRFLLLFFVSNLFAQGNKPPVTSLSGLSDVLISSPTNGQALTYDGVSKWKNVAVPGGSLSSLSDVSFSFLLDKQLLQYNAGTTKWNAYGPLAFSDITGNINVSQMNSGTGASGSTYWRGDNTWSVIANAGTIPATTNVLVGDNSGNATPSTTLFADNTTSTVQIIKSVNSGDVAGKVYNLGGTTTTASLMLSGAIVDPGATFRYYEGTYPTTGMIQNFDASINASFGRLLISGKNNVLFSVDAGTLAAERMRLGNGLMIGLTTDKGAGTANVSGGYYVNGNKIGGVATLSSTVDQTGSTETSHIAYTVPANTVQVGTTFRIFVWGNVDNGSTACTYTPRIRWGGTTGSQLMASPLIVSTNTPGTNRDWEINGRVTIRTTGASGTAVAMLHLAHHSLSAIPAYNADEASSGATAISINTSINSDIAFTWAMSTTIGTPHVRTIGGVIEIVEP